MYTRQTFWIITSHKVHFRAYFCHKMNPYKSLLKILTLYINNFLCDFVWIFSLWFKDIRIFTWKQIINFIWNQRFFFASIFGIYLPHRKYYLLFWYVNRGKYFMFLNCKIYKFLQIYTGFQNFRDLYGNYFIIQKLFKKFKII